MSAARARCRWMGLPALAWLLACSGAPRSAGGDGEPPDAAAAAARPSSSGRRSFDNSRERPGDLEPLSETSLTGKDANHDHIRDDVADYIDAEYGADERKRLMARQYARSVQHGLVYADDRDRAFEAAHESGRAIRCLHDRLDAHAASAIWKELQARTIDTEERLQAHARLQRTLSGGYFQDPRGEVCAFDMNGLAP